MIGYNEIEYASHTDVGVRRSHNQDSHVVMPAADEEHWRETGHVFLVADGMGAHAVGELASKMAVDNIPHIFSKHAAGGLIPALRRAFVEANTIIHTRGKQNREFEGMGTTGTALVLRPEGAWVGHVGDSRAYRIRAGVIEQLSFDHSLLWELARRQRKDPDELTGIPSNVIVRSLGPESAVQVDVEGPHPLERGDIFLLCSDGLSGQVNDRVIGAVATALPVNEAVRFLVHMANLQGGPDNTTVIIVRVGGEPRVGGVDSSAEVVFRADKDSKPVVPRFALAMYYLSKIPWHFVMFALGIALAVFAIILSMLGGESALLALMFGGFAILTGIVIMMAQNIRESRRSGNAPEQRIIQVYRQTPCPLDAAIYERLVQSAKTLEDSIKEKNWEYDARSYQAHLKLAAAHFKQNRLRDAFREQCRAMLVLMDDVHRYRGKNEDFKPLW
ncbi:MAG TPA: protein phosphatase 2C domain-containing protein [Gemmataceae bacterium]|nr:protein phosphatase 2C domain-containing protein [Gemmataceae bacterium]